MLLVQRVCSVKDGLYNRSILRRERSVERARLLASRHAHTLAAPLERILSVEVCGLCEWSTLAERLSLRKGVYFERDIQERTSRRG